MTILDTFKNTVKNFKRLDGEIGIEIETETKGSYIAPEFFFWTTHPDNSLRDFGVEYVLKQPVKYKDELPKALAEWEDRTKNFKFIKDSVSTSVHVHLNILNEKFVTLGNFLTYYTLFENLLVEFSGPNRLSNLFCLPIKDAEETVNNIRSMFQAFEKRNYKAAVFTENHVKYAALNLSAISRYGSVEIRTFRGETDIKIIRNWIDLLYSIMEAARKDTDPKKIMEEWKTKKVALLDDVFGDKASLLKSKDYDKKVTENLYYAGSIAYAVRDWSALDKPPEKFVPTKAQLEKYSMVVFGIEYNALTKTQVEYLGTHIQMLYDTGQIKSYTKKENLFDGPPERQRREEFDRALEAERERIRQRDAAAGRAVPMPEPEDRAWIDPEDDEVDL